MTHIAKIVLVAGTLLASAASATTGAKVTAMGFGNSQQHAKMVTIQTWLQAAFQEYGYSDWNNAYISNMECHKQAGGQAGGYNTTMQREVIRTGGNPSAPLSCIVSGMQEAQ